MRQSAILLIVIGSWLGVAQAGELESIPINDATLHILDPIQKPFLLLENGKLYPKATPRFKYRFPGGFSSFNTSHNQYTTAAAPSRDRLDLDGVKHRRSRFNFEEEHESRYASQYAVIRSSGDVYIKGKAGYIWEEWEDHPNDIPITEYIDNLDTNGAIGFGGGYELLNGDRVEFEYTVNKKDERLFSIGYIF